MATVGARLVNDGTLITAGEFDETELVKSGHSITVDTIFADELDEITLVGGEPSGGAIELNGTTQYLTLAGSADYQFGTGDFTIEGWFYFKGTNYTRLWCFPNGDNVELNGSTLYYWNGTTTASSGSGIINPNQWYHVALVRDSGNVTVYVNGTSRITDSSPLNSSTSRPLAIGGEVNTGADGFLEGYVTNFRIVKGTAVYTANFSTSSSPLAAITNTKLLLKATDQTHFLTDSSTSNKAVTNVGGAIFTTWTPLSTLYNGVMKQKKNGTLQVLNEFDENTVL